MLYLRMSFSSPAFKEILTFPLRKWDSSLLKTPPGNPRNFSSLNSNSIEGIQSPAVKFGTRSERPYQDTVPFAGVEDALMGFIFGKRKAIEVAHSVWQKVVRKGDTVVDATCGNGHDTVALFKMVADETGAGCVYGMDIQNSALENTSILLAELVNENERKLVKLFQHCHSKMEDIIPEGTSVRLVAFNLGYLPGGGNKAIITTSKTTLPALQAASRVLCSGGLISVMVYVGHPGGREELETVQAFAAGLAVEAWVCCKFEMLNRPTSPVLVLISKR